MIGLFHIIVYSAFIYKTLSQSIDSPCTLKSSGSSGVCKLLNDCTQIRDEIIQHHRLPQVCGFQETQSIVCCPLSGTGKRKPGEISREKCREYSSYAHQEPSGELVPKNQCAHKIVKRVIGGERASRREFPHMAILGFQSKSAEIHWLCGGSLISDQYILSGAVCANTHSYGEPKFVKLGITDLNDNDNKQELKIVQVISHPDYRNPGVYDDIALFKLDKPAVLHSYVRPACLYTKDTISEESAIATGWGSTGSRRRSNELLKVSLELPNNEDCNMSYKNLSEQIMPRGIDYNTQICAGSSTVQKNTCQGDSGGPLQIYHSSDDLMCMYEIIGITSFGKSSCTDIGVYTRVSYYVKWIEDIVWPVQ